MKGGKRIGRRGEKGYGGEGKGRGLSRLYLTSGYGPGFLIVWQLLFCDLRLHRSYVEARGGSWLCLDPLGEPSLPQAFFVFVTFYCMTVC